MWFKTEEKRNREDQELVKKTIQETLLAQQFQQGNLNTYTYPNQAEKKKPKTNSLSKWVSAKEVAEMKGLKDVQWTRDLMTKGYFGQVAKKGGSKRVLREIVENTELAGQGNPITYKNKPKTFPRILGDDLVESLKTNSLSSASTNDVRRSKWVKASEVSEMKGMNSTQWGRDKMVKGYFGKTKGKGTRKSPLKVLREVVENTELIESGRGRPKTMDRPFPSDTRDYRKVNKKPKNKYYLSKWVTAREVAEIKGMGKSWAMILINRGHFGKTTGKGVRHNPLKVLREVVENTEMIGREDYGKVKSSSSDRPKQETFKPTINPLAYEQIRNQLMEDKEFLIAVSREVMRNLKFVTKLDNE